MAQFAGAKHQLAQTDIISSFPALALDVEIKGALHGVKGWLILPESLDLGFPIGRIAHEAPHSFGIFLIVKMIGGMVQGIGTGMIILDLIPVKTEISQPRG